MVMAISLASRSSSSINESRGSAYHIYSPKSRDPKLGRHNHGLNHLKKNKENSRLLANCKKGIHDTLE